MTTNDKLADALDFLACAPDASLAAPPAQGELDEWTDRLMEVCDAVADETGWIRLADGRVFGSRELFCAITAKFAPQPAPAPVQVDAVPRCPKCGYTYEDCLIHWDHRLCGEPDPSAAAQPPAPGEAELPPLPNPQVPFIGCDPSLTDVRVLVNWYKRGATAYARAAIAALAQQPQQVDVVNLLRYLTARLSYGTGELVHPEELPTVRGFHRSVWEAADALEAEHHRLALIAANGDSTAPPEAQQRVPDAVDLEQFRGAVSLLHLTCRRRIRDVRKGVFPAHYLPVFEQDLAQASALLDLIASQQESRK